MVKHLLADHVERVDEVRQADERALDPVVSGSAGGAAVSHPIIINPIKNIKLTGKPINNCLLFLIFIFHLTFYFYFSKCNNVTHLVYYFNFFISCLMLYFLSIIIHNNVLMVT